MSATAPKTLPPPPAAERDLVEEQRALTLALTNHADPHIRMLAHISERQMAFVELLSGFSNTLAANTSAIEELTRIVRNHGTRQDEHERQYPLQNGSGDVHADAQ